MTSLLVKMFIRNPEYTEDAHVRAAYGKLAGVTGIVCNLFLFAVKLAIGLFSRSISITADAFNNLTDIGSAVVSLIGFSLAAKPPDDDHPFGHARFEYLSGLAVAAMILIVGVQFLINSVKKILHPEAVSVTTLMAVLLLLSLLVKIVLARFYTNLGERIASSSLKATGRDSFNDVLTTAVVLTAAVVERFTGLTIDGFMGLAVSLMILYGCTGIVRETVSPLLGETADPVLVKRIAEKINGYDKRIMGIHDLMVHDYGPGRRFATVHMEIDAREDVLKTHDLIDDIEKMILREENIQLLIHHDPIVTDDPEQNHLWRMIKKILAQIDPLLKMHDFHVDSRTEYPTIRFDLVVPPETLTTEEEITKRIRHVLDREEKKYLLEITYDTQSFNRYLKE